MGAASKGIIQRGHQHNAMVYKSPYAKNPFDSITDEELDEYKKVVEKKAKGEFEASPVEHFLRAERVSVNSNKSYQVVASTRYSRNIAQNYYRTQSHAGFPKGSYIIPNPTHFHIVRQSQIAKMRPTIVTIHNTSSNYIFNHPYRSQSKVTINLGNTHSVSVNIPLEVATGFIYPFVAALRQHSGPILNNQGSQTSYMHNFERKQPTTADYSRVDYTPLYVDSYQTCHTLPEDISQVNSFEKRVLDNMKQNLLADLNLSFSDSESDSMEKSNKFDPGPIQDITNFSEGDELEINESLCDLTPEVAAMLPKSDSSTSSDSIKMEMFQQLPFHEQSVEPGTEIVQVAENVVDKVMKLSANTIYYNVFKDVVDTAKGYLRSNLLEPINIVNSIDEGIEDCTLRNEITANSVLKIDKILHDANVDKLLTELMQIYEEHYGDTLKEEEKSGLRLTVASYVLKMLEIDDRFKESSDESNDSNIVNDKIFTISEFLSDILDHFFDTVGKTYEGAKFSEFEKQVTENSEYIFHSTPESQKINMKNINSPHGELDPSNTDVTSFKKMTKTGSETYWITLYSSPKLEEVEVTPKKRIINVDDIPLKPPKDFVNVNSSRKILSPILEEPRVNLFDSRLSEDFDVPSVSAFDEKYEIIDDTSESSDDEIIEKVSIEENEKTNSYVAFDRPEVNVVVYNNKENEPPDDDFDGDWMGFKWLSENTVNGDQSDAHEYTISETTPSLKGLPRKIKKKKKGLRTPSFLKKKKEKKIREA
ncbi:hypothetical protein NQ318_014650 [Aromia moschata]|uniref:Uncharacterized protein n=1 Tax=Aromia moschata TaxID=1265417 RepID=A0AAV8ZBE3_9CUCU|nr:hypothetical protein NQ318_014650 [Aromia moschata]